VQNISIIHVVSNAPPLFGGAARQAIHLSTLLTHHGINSEIVSLDDAAIESTTTGIKRISKRGITGLILSYRHINNSSPHVVMIHGGVKRLLFFTLLLPRRIQIIFKITTEMEIERINNSSVARYILDGRGVNLANITNINCKVRNQWFISNIPQEIAAAKDLGRKNADNSRQSYIVIGAICSRKRTDQIILQFITAKNKNIINGDCLLYFYGPYQNNFAEFDGAYVSSIFDLTNGRDDIRLEGHVDLPAVGFPEGATLIHSAESEGCPNSVLEFLYLEKSVIVSSNLQQNFPSRLQSFINFVEPDNLFVEMIAPAKGAKKVLEELKNYYIEKIKCAVCSLQ